MITKLQALAQQKWFQLLAALMIGMAVGAIFYPKKNTEEKTTEQIASQYEQQIQQLTQKQATEVKTLNDKITSEETDKQQIQQTMSQQIQTLNTENDSLKQSSTKTISKVVKPDGTVIENETDNSTSDSTKSDIAKAQSDFNSQLTAVQEQDKKHEEDVVSQVTQQLNEQISTLKTQIASSTTKIETDKKTESNPSKLRPEIGITSNLNGYVHATYTLFGPVFVGAGVSGTTTHFDEARIGLGIEF